MPTAPYALSSIPLSSADKPAVDLTGRPIPRDSIQDAQAPFNGAGRQHGLPKPRTKTVDSVTGGRALTNPFSAPGSPAQLHAPLDNNSEWDLSTHSFTDDRGGGLVGYNEQFRQPGEGEAYDEGESLAAWDPYGYCDGDDEGRIREYTVGQQYGTWGRAQRELDTIPEGSSEDISSFRSVGSSVTINNSIHRRGVPEHSALDKDSRYPTFPLPSKTITTQPLPSIVMSTGEFDEIKERAMPRDWDTGLCPFSENCSKCCLGLWCPCVVYSQNKTRCEHMRHEGVPLYAEDRKWCTGDCISYALLSLCCFAWPLQTSNRAQIRDLLNIKGNCFGDCTAVCCCSSCALAQESRELTLEERELRLTISPSETM